MVFRNALCLSLFIFVCACSLSLSSSSRGVYGAVRGQSGASRCLLNSLSAAEAVRGQVYNVSSQEYVTFDGMAKVCAEAAGIRDPQIVHYDPKILEAYKAWRL